MDWLLDKRLEFSSTGSHIRERCYSVGYRVSAEHTCYYVQLLNSYRLNLSSDVVGLMALVLRWVQRVEFARRFRVCGDLV